MKKKRQRYEKSQFSLAECEININIIEKSEDKGHGCAFLNVHLPDGRWATFKTAEANRIPLYKKEEA